MASYLAHRLMLEDVASDYVNVSIDLVYRTEGFRPIAYLDSGNELSH